jgi:transposase, IS5 family
MPWGSWASTISTSVSRRLAPRAIRSRRLTSSFLSRARAEIEAVVRLAPEERKSNAGRKPFDAVLMFKVLVLQALYNLADEHVEYLIRDRLSFMRFLGLGLEDSVPDATTVWLFREALAKAGLVKTLFDRFNRHLDAKGYFARGGQIVDATIVSAPQQHNSREENEAIKAGKTPEGWEEKPAKNAQKDKDARWTKKNAQNLRLQEPHRRRPQAQNHSALYRV